MTIVDADAHGARKQGSQSVSERTGAGRDASRANRGAARL
jgi:hypothetical protein